MREFKSLENAKNCLIGDLRFWFVLVSRLYNVEFLKKKWRWRWGWKEGERI